jgi:hypothetical protein
MFIVRVICDMSVHSVCIMWVFKMLKQVVLIVITSLCSYVIVPVDSVVK